MEQVRRDNQVGRGFTLVADSVIGAMGPLLIIEGIFKANSEGFLVTPDSGAQDIFIDLSSYEGRAVFVQVHHFPPIPPLPREGGGSCMWPSGMCPHGHQINPAWMYSLELEGTLERFGTDWIVGGSPPILERMPGHKGRLVVFDRKPVDLGVGNGESTVPQDLDLEALMSEAGGLLSQFEMLQKSMRNKS